MISFDSDAYMARHLPNLQYSINEEGFPFGDFETPALESLEEDYLKAETQGWYADWGNFTRSVLETSLISRLLAENSTNSNLIIPLSNALSLGLGESSRLINNLMMVLWQMILFQAAASGFSRTPEETIMWNKAVKLFRLPAILILEDRPVDS